MTYARCSPNRRQIEAVGALPEDTSIVIGLLNTTARTWCKQILEMIGLRRAPLLRPTERFYTASPDTPKAIKKSLRHVKESGLSGDYYEFGLYRGFTLCFAQRAATVLGLAKMRFFGLDSFQGLPAPTGIDGQPTRLIDGRLAHFHAGDYACSVADVTKNLTENGVDWSRTCLIEGFYEASLSPELKVQYRMTPAAVILIDCDYYSSTCCVLEFIADLLQENTVLLFDDWNCFAASDDMGQRRAFREFLQRHHGWRAKPFVTFGWHGQGFLLKLATVG